LNDAIVRGLPIFPGKFYLEDAGYALRHFCLTPYRGSRYHLREWRMAGDPEPLNHRELFNLRHSSLRNVVERAFGIIKKRFPILKFMHSFSFPFQRDLVKCCFLLHNYIQMTQAYDDDFARNEVGEEDEQEEDPLEVVAGGGMNVNALNAWRDGIAQQMWEAYRQEE
jgi:hypothetical protein